jgi:hypothetical protein
LISAARPTCWISLRGLQLGRAPAAAGSCVASNSTTIPLS